MQVLMVVSANKYTGAAAVAEHDCRALHSAGVEASLLFLAGRNLETRLAGEHWAHAGLVKERTPARFVANLKTIRNLGRDADVVVSHLPHDTFLCVAAGAHRESTLVRNFRNLGHLRADPYHRLLARRLSGALLAHSAMLPALERLRPALPQAVVPVPLEDRFAAGAEGSTWRRRLGIPAEVPVLGMVGKVAPGRGFDLLLETAARVRPEVHVLPVGHGEEQPRLERLARRLGLEPRLHWAGYQETELPQLYAAMDVVLYPAQGSDHGHRAISEAQACRRPVVAAGLPGVVDLIEPGRTGEVVPADAAALAAAVSRVLADGAHREALLERAAAAVKERRFAPCGRRLADFLAAVVGRQERYAP